MERKPFPFAARVKPAVIASAFALVACAESPSHDPEFSFPNGGTDLQGSSPGLGSDLLQSCGATRAFQSSACSRSERELRDGDEAALGFAAEALTRLISGEHRAELTWSVDGERSDRRSELVLTVVPLGPVHFVEQSSISAASETYTFGNTGAEYFTCGDRLAVDAQLTIVMPDGSLNETIEVSVEAESANYARISVRQPGDSIVGSLRSAVAEQGADALGMTLASPSWERAWKARWASSCAAKASTGGSAAIVSAISAWRRVVHRVPFH
jgi:hypothetical protein